MLYVGHFTCDEAQDGDEREAHFDLLVEAPSAEQASEAFKEYLIRFRRTRQDLFQDVKEVFLQGMAEVPSPLLTPALVHYTSRHVLDEPRGIVSCTLVDGPAGSAAFGWEEEPENGEPVEVEPFVTF